MELLSSQGAWALAAKLLPACLAAIPAATTVLAAADATSAAPNLCRSAQAAVQQLQQAAAGAKQEVASMVEALPEVPAVEHTRGRLQPGMALGLLQQQLHAACTAAAAARSSEAQAAGAAAQAQVLVQHSTALLLPLALQLLAVPPAEASEAQHSKGLLAASMACAAQSGGCPGTAAVHRHAVDVHTVAIGAVVGAYHD